MAVRREKYRAVERKKCWEHQLRRQREKIEDMDGIVQGMWVFNTEALTSINLTPQKLMTRIR